jgi:hypothetical protein
LNACSKLDLSNFAGGTPIYLEVNKDLDPKVLDNMYDIIKSNNGGSFVFLTYSENGKKLTFKFNKKTSITIKDKLESLLNGDK